LSDLHEIKTPDPFYSHLLFPLQALEAMVQAGASGYMLKDGTFSDLTRAIRTVAAGQSYFSPGLGLPGSGGEPPTDPRAES